MRATLRYLAILALVSLFLGAAHPAYSQGTGSGAVEGDGEATGGDATGGSATGITPTPPSATGTTSGNQSGRNTATKTDKPKKKKSH